MRVWQALFRWRPKAAARLVLAGRAVSPLLPPLGPADAIRCRGRLVAGLAAAVGNGRARCRCRLGAGISGPGLVGGCFPRRIFPSAAPVKDGLLSEAADGDAGPLGVPGVFVAWSDVGGIEIDGHRVGGFGVARGGCPWSWRFLRLAQSRPAGCPPWRQFLSLDHRNAARDASRLALVRRGCNGGRGRAMGAGSAAAISVERQRKRHSMRWAVWVCGPRSFAARRAALAE